VGLAVGALVEGAVGRVPQGHLVDGRQGAHGVVAGGAGGEVVGADPGDLAAAVAVGQHVDRSVEAAVLGGHVGPAVDVDDAAGAHAGAQHDQAATRVVGQLGVDAPLGAVQRTGQELGERQASGRRHPADHRQTGMEVHRLHPFFPLDDQTIHQHGSTLVPLDGKGPGLQVTWGRPPRRGSLVQSHPVRRVPRWSHGPSRSTIATES
jgi:hypothetical protein